MAIGHAREFHRHMAEIFHRIPKDDVNKANEHFAANRNLMVFFATNQIFACELYLKAIYLLQGKRAPDTHNVWALFKRLPKEDKSNIEKVFLEEMAKLPTAMSMHILITKRSNVPEEEVKAAIDGDPNQPKGDFMSLERVLKDTGDSYQTWRYLFQSIAAEKDSRVVRFHWCHLHCFCVAVDRMIVATEKKLRAT